MCFLTFVSLLTKELSRSPDKNHPDSSVCFLLTLHFALMASHFLLLAQKKVTKENGTPTLAALRVPSSLVVLWVGLMRRPGAQA